MTDVQVDLAQGTDSGAHKRFPSLLDDARRRGFSSVITFAGWVPGIWRLFHGEVDAGLEDVLAWTEESHPLGLLREYTVQALLSAGRVDEARAHLELVRRDREMPVTTARTLTLDGIVARVDGDLIAAERLAHEALTAQHELGVRPSLVHTFELLSSIGSARGSYVECARLAGAAQALRNEMGYVQRWPYEQVLHDSDAAAACASLGSEAFDSAFKEGLMLGHDEAVAYARRARGERKRPTTGWESLTPTEEEIVRLAVTGLTNREIGNRLLMGAETVKTHLAHIYDKTGVRSRAALATEFVARDDAATHERLLS
jgi:DNA-binding CsgD family transcriptional regulator